MSHPNETAQSDTPIEPRENRPPAPDSGGGLREVFHLAYPVVLTQMSMTVMGVVDSAMVGRLGALELAAVGFGGIWFWTLFCGFLGTAASVQTFVAQRHGADRPLECGGWAWQGLYTLIPPIVLASIALVFFVTTLLAWLAPSAEVQPIAAEYMSLRAVGVAGECAAMVLAAFFRGTGDTRTPLYATLFANALNVLLDYGLIFGELGLPEWGVAGAAIATSISEWVFAALLLWAFLRPATRRQFRTGWVRPSTGSFRRLLRTGLPVGGQWMLEMLSFSAFLTLVARMGDIQMAASQAFISLLSISFMQASGISAAVSTLVGRYIGAERPQAVAQSYASAMKLALGLSSSVALLFAAAPDLLMRIFTTDAEVIALGSSLLIVGAAYQFFDAYAIVTDGALLGAGDTRWPFVVRFCLSWGVFLPSAWYLGVHLDLGLSGAWLGGVGYVMILCFYLVWRFKSGAWKKLQI